MCCLFCFFIEHHRMQILGLFHANRINIIKNSLIKNLQKLSEWN